MVTEKNSFQCLYIFDFRFYFIPISGYFSSFPHGTCSLSVIEKYLDLVGGPTLFKQNTTVSVLLEVFVIIFTGLLPYKAKFSKIFKMIKEKNLNAQQSRAKSHFLMICFRSPLLTKSLLIL